MTAIFISHRSCDNSEAEDLKGWLAKQGHERLFLDFDPANGIPAGVDWEQRLYQELRRCQALLIVLTPAWLESKWCGNELAIAREKGKAVFVVRVKPCVDGPLIPAIQEVDLTLDRNAGLEKLARGLGEHGLDPRDSFDWKPDRPIYPGLAAFDVDDAAIFFGRSEESWQVVEALRRMRLQATGSPKLLLITGASGSGKSSLMRAGVLARLRKEPASWITARPFRRGVDALRALADALAWTFPPDRRPTSLEAITARLTGPDGAGQLLALARELRFALDRPEATLVLPLDQAEELLAAERADDAAKLLDLFRATLTGVGNEILVIATIRSDRLGAWQQHASIKATADHGELPFEMLPLGPMPMARIGEIVRGPAAYEGLRIDDDLVDVIRADTVSPDALPLLAYTLQYLHRQFAKDGRLTLAEYRSFDGLEGSVRSQADAAIPIERLSEEDRRALHEAFVPGLVRATAQGGFSRSRALLATLPPRAEPHLRRLIDEARLLTMGSDPVGGVTVEVAHESLLRVWPTLARWIAEDTQSLRRLEAMQRAAADWAHAGRGEEFLVHRDHRLSDAEALIAEPRFATRLDDPDRDYLAACRNAQNQREAAEKEAQQRELRAAQALAEEQKAKTRRTRIGLGFVGGLFVVACGLGLWGWDRAGEAKWQATAAEAARMEAVKQEEEAKRQLALSNKALATSLWNDLDFTVERGSSSDPPLTPGELKALWTLAVDDGQVRGPFLDELQASTDRMLRFGRRPALIARALGLKWPSAEQAQAALDPVLHTVKGTCDASLLQPLAQAVQVLAEKLTAEQARTALGPLLDLANSTCDASVLRPRAEIARSLAAQLTAEQAQVALGPLLDAINRTTMDPRYLPALAMGVQMLAGKLTAEQAQVTLGAVLTATERVMDPPVQALGLAVEALAGKLTAAQAQAVLSPLLDAIKRTNDYGGIEALGPAVQVLAGKLTTEQAQAALGPLVDAINRTNDYAGIGAVALAVQALAPKLRVQQARAALGPLLDAINRTTDPRALDALAQAVQALPVQLTAEQASRALDPVLELMKKEAGWNRLQGLARAVQALAGQLVAEQAQTALGPLLDAINRTTEPRALDALAQAVQALPVQLTAEQAQAALGPPLDAINRTAETDQHHALAEAVQALAGKLMAEQGLAALPQMLDAMERAPSSPQRLALEQAVQALAGTLTTEQAPVALRQVLDIVMTDPYTYYSGPAAQAMQTLAGKLAAEQARAALDPILEAMNERADWSALIALTPVVQVLGPHLTADQARSALGTMLAAINGEHSSNAEPELALAVQALAVPLTTEQARDVFGLVLRGIESTSYDEDRRQLVQAVQGLAGKLTAEQASMALDQILEAITGTSDPPVLQTLAQAVQALSVKLTIEQASAALDIIRSRFAWATVKDEAEAWAGALASLVLRASPTDSLPVLVDALKYPISAGASTDVLLDALSGIDPKAPGKEAGLAANLAWLKTAYPAIDLDARPVCPPPPPDHEGVACPVDGT